MSDEERGLRDELEQVKAERDRYASLVGTAYNDDGSVVPALLNALNQETVEQTRHEVQAVVNFLRENRPV